MMVITSSIAHERGSVVVELEYAEALAIAGALRESIAAVKEWEYHIRTGVEKGEAEQLLQEFRRLLKP
ncbi:hypothetical protein [Cellulomonas sp.]|uniref:hypothetical protein n=1 Tax=Cellulomonas sp. TaxID=40001 RepID=UPI002D301819|nr:hypothetical protein [Cellulomonas sp.]HYQ74879.1 hypothetical protein [Cellulomonas sp.]